MQTYGSVASVVAAIRDEAAAEVERIEQQGADDATRLRTDADNASVTIADRAEQLAGARRAVATELASIEWEGRRGVIEQREAWIAKVVRGASEQWTSDRVTLTALAQDALANLPPLPCAIAVAQKDTIIADEAWCAELAHATGKPAVTLAPFAQISGGCVAICGDITFDNSIEARSRRLESEWRSALSRLYAVAT